MKDTGILVLGYNDMKDTSTYDVKKTLKDGWTEEIEVRYSKLDNLWNKPGEIAAKLENTGDGFLIYFDDRVIQLDYCQASVLRALLKLEDTENATFKYYKESK